ncbi:MAG: hypothetical protein V7L01_34130 [Nostoc sp.]|uniref:hypothetical protein n=1 Tax=Nostoc sp. TaxID=1180 RepID=UPI002FF76432
MTKTVIAELSAIPEKFLEKGVKASQCESVGCLYPYLETKKLLDGSTVFYPRVIGVTQITPFFGGGNITGRKNTKAFGRVKV